jgi:hypothetical protein
MDLHMYATLFFFKRRVNSRGRGYFGPFFSSQTKNTMAEPVHARHAKKWEQINKFSIGSIELEPSNMKFLK